VSDDQSAPVEPEALPQPSADAEPGREPGAGATEAEGNAEFATATGESTPHANVPTEAESAPTRAEQTEQTKAEAAPAWAEQTEQTETEAARTQGEQTEQTANAPAAADGFAQDGTSSTLVSAPGGPAAPEALTWAGFAGPYAAAPDPAPARPRSKALLGTGIGLGYAALAAVAAFAVIAIASPGPVHVAGLADANASATTSPPAAPSPSAPATSAAPSTAPPTTATPTSTVTGRVSGGVHTGDLRFFLLPPPDGASSVQGDPDGTTETLAEVVDQYGGSSDVKSTLKQFGFKSACDRTYQDSNLGANVEIQLLRLGGSGDASDWLSGFQETGDGIKSIKVPGESGAKGYSYKDTGTYQLTGVYRDGDTFFEVDIYGTEPISAADLASVIKAEHARLANG
jgi:hypothetical protein